MPLNKVAAAYLSLYAYVGDPTSLAIPPANALRGLLAGIPQGDANGPWTLLWGPAANGGILGYVAQGRDGAFALAFRGTEVDGGAADAFSNVAIDVNVVALSRWIYPLGSGANVAAGVNIALALAIGMTDPASDVMLLDFLRGVAKANPGAPLMVTGHSLGGALAVAATAWLDDQLPKIGAPAFSLWPHSFAAPTFWDATFAGNFSRRFPYYAAINSNDVIPMAWHDTASILASYPSPPGPSLYNSTYYYWTVYLPLSAIGTQIAPGTYKAITPTVRDSFAAPFSGDDWGAVANQMHSMQDTYFPHVTGKTAPEFPAVERLAGPHPRPRVMVVF
jgi:hypothetical protein